MIKTKAATLTLAIICLWAVDSQAKSRSAPIYGKHIIKNRIGLVPKAGRIDSKQIRRAAVSCLRTHLDRSRSGFTTIAQRNRIDPRSIKLKLVQFRSSRRNSQGYRMGGDEMAFRAVYEVMKGKEGQQKKVNLYLESEMNLAKQLPRFRPRVEWPGQGKVRTIPFGAQDHLTVTWVD